MEPEQLHKGDRVQVDLSSNTWFEGTVTYADHVMARVEADSTESELTGWYPRCVVRLAQASQR
jgi:hypothetical protein